MSGGVDLERSSHWAHITLSQGMSISVATTVQPDGSVYGPSEYFAGVQAEYDRWMTRLVPKLDELLAQKAPALGLLPVGDEGGQLVQVDGDALTDSISVRLRMAADLEMETSVALGQELQKLADEVRRMPEELEL